MQYDAIILAGGESSVELKKYAPYDNEALIVIGQYPMIYYVHKALCDSPSVRNIVISGPVDVLTPIFKSNERLFFVNGGNSVIDSLTAGIQLLRQKEISDQLLILPTDIPFITTAAIEDFLRQAENNPAQFHYPVISKEVSEATYPGVKRTYVRLRDGVFTGGNLFLAQDNIIDPVLELARELVARRKKPWSIARLFGVNLFLRFLWGKLTIAAAEKRFNQVTGITGRAIISSYAEVGVDVDKASDLELAQKYLKDTIF